ncbi:DUF7005 family protein [Spirosoma arcticum]
MTAISSNWVLNNESIHVSDELKGYFQNKFCAKETRRPPVSIDEPYLDSWEEYVTKANEGEAFQLLRKCYPQLNFPIGDGINKTQGYIDAVLKGKPLATSGKALVGLNKPEAIRIKLHTSIAGKVPVLFVADDEDFVKLVQCFLHKNNPTPVPQSMGALLANGVNNWDRIHTLKDKWLLNNPAETWNQEFSTNVLSKSGLYKDKLIMLSTKPYSNVPADRLGLTEAEWASYSLFIRLEHECTHLYTLNRYGCASNNLHDELIADYIGISKTTGTYYKEWMLAFMGLEDYPAYRKGARLENYLGDANLTVEQFKQLVTVIKSAIESIACFDAALGTIHSAHDQVCRMDALCATDLATMSSANGSTSLLQKYEELMRS